MRFYYYILTIFCISLWCSKIGEASCYHHSSQEIFPGKTELKSSNDISSALSFQGIAADDVVKHKKIRKKRIAPPRKIIVPEIFELTLNRGKPSNKIFTPVTTNSFQFDIAALLYTSLEVRLNRFLI